LLGSPGSCDGDELLSPGALITQPLDLFRVSFWKRGLSFKVDLLLAGTFWLLTLSRSLGHCCLMTKARTV
jgi:hypothetical protein